MAAGEDVLGDPLDANLPTSQRKSITPATTNAIVLNIIDSSSQPLMILIVRGHINREVQR
jgi:hypothetical protein